MVLMLTHKNNKLVLFKVVFSNDVTYQKTSVPKALNGIQWEVAHPLSLNYGAPVGSMDTTICVGSAGIPYVGITKGFKFLNLKPFVIPTYEVPALVTHMVTSIDAIGVP